MHILITTDQHPDSLGGVQVSIRLQKRFLESAGHTVSVVSSRLFRDHPGDASFFGLPSIPVSFDREYSLHLPSKRGERILERALITRPPVDIVHVQGDFWGALVGYRFAERHSVPVVHTMHNHLDFGLRQVVPVPDLAIRGLLWWQHRLLKPTLSQLAPSAWSFLNEYTLRASAVTAPSSHFARLLEHEGVAADIDVVWNGVDDSVVEKVLADQSAESAASAGSHRRRPRFVWVGRMSHEKRILEFLEAVHEAQVDAEFRLYGGGLLLNRARNYVGTHGLGENVTFMGSVPYGESLAAIADADALVQTSIGFESQGMTVFEAAALGTPSIISDPNIAGELPPETHVQTEDASVSALARAISRVAAEVRDGNGRRPDPQTGLEFRQSHQTERMLEVYKRVLR